MKTSKKLKKLNEDFKYYNDLIGKTGEPRSHLLLIQVEQRIKIIVDEMKEEVSNPKVKFMEQWIEVLFRFVTLKKKYFKQ